MAKRSPAPRDIDGYIAGFPPDVQTILTKIRAAIRDAAPDAEETISYAMPAFKQRGILIYFAAFKNHIGLYPPVRGDEKLQAEIAPYQGEKGNLKFPLDKPIPYRLITKIVKSRVKAQAEKAASKRGKR